MSYDLTPGIKLSAQDHDFHSRELARLRELAATITTKAVKARVMRQVQEHGVLIGLDTAE